MPYDMTADLPQSVQDEFSSDCQQVWLDAFNATIGTDVDRALAADAAADVCAAAKAEEPVEPDCGCDHAVAGRGGAERKVLPLDSASVDDTGSGEFSGYANVFGIVDDGGDKVLKGAFKSVIPQFLKEGFISWNHDWATPVAMPIEATEDAKGLLIKARFHGTATAQDARRITQERLAAGLSMGLSIGYEVGDAKDTNYGRDIASFKRLFETGLVLVPMNRPSNVTAAKGSLGSGKPYAERLSLALAQADAIEREFKWLATHTTQRAELRQKEGRVLSGANRDRLTELKKSLAAVLRDIEELLQATDPGRDKAAAQAALARSFLTLSGVN